MIVGVNAGADGGAAHVHVLDFVRHVLHPGKIPQHHGPVRPEFLPQPNGHRVLHLGAAHFQNGVKFPGLFLQRVHQPRQLLFQPPHQLQHRHLPRRGNHVVGGLGHVHVVVGMHQGVIALFAPQNLNGPVGHHFVDVHVGGSARAPLNGVGNELIPKFSGENLVAGLHNGAHLFRSQPPVLAVHQRRGLLDFRQGIDEFRRQAPPRNVEILRGPQGLKPVINPFVDGRAAYHVRLYAHVSSLPFV